MSENSTSIFLDNISSRVLKEQSLKDRSSFEEIVMNLSSRFINLELDEVEEGINHALQIVGEAIGADHGCVCLVSDNPATVTGAYEWCREDCKLQTGWARKLSVAQFPWMPEKIKQDQTVHVLQMADLSPEANAEKEFLQSNGCQSLILVFMVLQKSLLGFMGFDSGRAEKRWPKEILGQLKMVGEIFGGVLARQRMEEDLQKIEEKYRNLVENINEVIFSLDTQGRFTYLSPVIEQVALCKVEEMIGKPFTSFIHPEDLPKFLSFLKLTLIDQSEPQEFRILNKQGHIREVRISGRRVLHGDQLVGLTGILSDITQEKFAAVLLDRAEAKYHGLFANAVEGIFQCTLEGRFIVSNPACARTLGYESPEELIIQDSVCYRPHFVDPKRYKELMRLLEEHGLAKGFEAQVFRKEGSKIWISANVLAIRDASGAVVFYEGTMVDITERKRADDQIRYLSFHDKLTGLYNRAYFEEELKRLDTNRELPISVIMGDLNGLKLVNDAFGHQEGDKLLTQIAKILKESCRKEDVIARWGGDEFAIFLPRTGYRVAMEIIERIKLACRPGSQDLMQVSIALGAVTKEDPLQDIREILKEAEKRMYRNKLIESKCILDSIISSLQRTLFEKSYESEEHTYRLRRLALQIGRTVGLPGGQLDDLELLATLHDIGKIGVPEGVITKPGILSPEEWELIRKHPEIGYRIARSSLELAPIAEAILAHHEWWDGGGYPRGLKGEEIPLISRIIAMVDAYDVMTHAQPYKEAMSQKEALQELQKKAGSQFDPKLTAMFIEMVCAA
jgi:diguanylate cyclase (GGDEF)-like protein/PAS domain S-box-containing protein